MYHFKITDEPFARGYINAGTDGNIYISTGAGYIAAAQAANILFDPDTGFPSFDFGNMACTSSFGSGQTANFALLEKKAQDNPVLAEDYRYIARKMKRVDMDARIWSAFSQNEVEITTSKSGWGGTWAGHAVPNLIDFARFGTDGIREKINRYQGKNPDSQAFYEGLLLTLHAIDILGEKIYTEAQVVNQNKKDPKLCRVIDTFARCPRQPARTFTEASLVFVMITMLDGKDSPGHFDQYMIDFWNTSPYGEARQMLEDMWVWFHKTRAWNLCISGSDENWNDISNSLTYEILDVARKFQYQTPNITMRCHRNTPQKLWDAAVETIATGIGMPALYNDEVVCPALERLGIPPEDAHRYVMNGCNQIDIQGKSHMGLEDGEVNLGLCVSYAIFGGYSMMQDKYIGALTPPAEDLDTFEKFLDALKDQMVHLMDAVCSMANKAHKIRALCSSNPIRSITIEGCIEKGLDYKNRGPLYGHGQVLFEGVPECIDSVANIKKFVYEEKKYTLSEVRNALMANFEGFEDMHRTFQNSGLNFGNGNAYVDQIGAMLIDFCNGYLLTKPTERGGMFSGGCSPFERAAINGRASGPLPNGKKREDHLYGDSIGATPGKDKKGPTALLNSCLCFDQTLAGSGFILNVKFDKKLFCAPVGKEAFMALGKTYFERGGQQLSVTVVSAEELLDAQKNPDKHKNLIVRVGGFSEYFVNLTAELQENVILRTTY